MTNTTPLPVEQADELQQKTWELLLKVMSEGERHKLNSDILTPYHTQLLELLAAQATAAQERVIEIAHQPCECGRDHFATPVRSVTGVLTSYCQFSRIVPTSSFAKPEQKEQEQK